MINCKEEKKKVNQIEKYLNTFTLGTYKEFYQ